MHWLNGTNIFHISHMMCKSCADCLCAMVFSALSIVLLIILFHVCAGFLSKDMSDLAISPVPAKLRALAGRLGVTKSDQREFTTGRNDDDPAAVYCRRPSEGHGSSFVASSDSPQIERQKNRGISTALRNGAAATKHLLEAEIRC